MVGGAETYQVNAPSSMALLQQMAHARAGHCRFSCTRSSFDEQSRTGWRCDDLVLNGAPRNRGRVVPRGSASPRYLMLARARYSMPWPVRTLFDVRASEHAN